MGLFDTHNFVSQSTRVNTEVNTVIEAKRVDRHDIYDLEKVKSKIIAELKILQKIIDDQVYQNWYSYFDGSASCVQEAFIAKGIKFEKIVVPYPEEIPENLIDSVYVLDRPLGSSFFSNPEKVKETLKSFLKDVEFYSEDVKHVSKEVIKGLVYDILIGGVESLNFGITKDEFEERFNGIMESFNKHGLYYHQIYGSGRVFIIPVGFMDEPVKVVEEEKKEEEIPSAVTIHIHEPVDFEPEKSNNACAIIAGIFGVIFGIACAVTFL